MIELDKIYNIDCLEGMNAIASESVDCIICDLPYGTTPCKWDKSLPLAKLWAQYERIIKPEGVIVLFAQQPFTTYLINSNLRMWRYNWIWVKESGTNFMNSHHQPMRITEDICIFGNGSVSYSKLQNYMRYNPQMRTGFTPFRHKQGKMKEDCAIVRQDKYKQGGIVSESNGERYPVNVLFYNRDRSRLHPTQKPVDLVRYLVRTYSNESDIILDNCMGSGTTAIACIREHRHFIGFELDEQYFNLATKRIEAEVKAPMLS